MIGPPRAFLERVAPGGSHPHWVRAVVGLALATVVVASSSFILSCARPSGTGDLEREYVRLHASTDVETLSRTQASVADVVAAIRSRSDSQLRILLPSRLPDGFSVAAPFRGTGSGNPLPNPDAWGTGYAVTYTDGRARLTLIVGAADVVEGGRWVSTGRTLEGRPLFFQRRDSLSVVAVDPGGDAPIVVIGERLEDAVVLEMAASLRRPPGP